MMIQMRISNINPKMEMKTPKAFSMVFNGRKFGREMFGARPPAVGAKSNIGAGDSLMAGLVWGWVEGWPLDEVIRWAVAAGTAAVMEEGSGVCSLARMEALCPHVTVTRF